MRRRGYTLIELVIALTLLVVGVLAVAATAAPIARLIRWGAAQTASAALAGARIEELRAAGCGSMAGGGASGGGVRLTWTVAPAGRLRAVTVVASYPWASGTRNEVVETVVACPE